MLHYLNQHFTPSPMPSGESVIIQKVSRRVFLKGGVSGAGLVLAMQVLPFKTASAFETYDHGGHAMPNGVVNDPHVFVSIDPDGTVMGMTLALHSGVTFKNGRAEQSNYHDYDVIRIDNFPLTVYTHIVPHDFAIHATGAGEPGIPPIAPAIANGIFNATGKRIRHLPIKPEDIRDA